MGIQTYDNFTVIHFTADHHIEIEQRWPVWLLHNLIAYYSVSLRLTLRGLNQMSNVAVMGSTT